MSTTTTLRVLKVENLNQHGQKWNVTEKTLWEILKNFSNKRVSTPKLPVTLGHAPQGREFEAVGFIRNLGIEKYLGDMWLTAEVEFTNDSVVKSIRENQAWKYCSIEATPVATHPNTGKVIGARLDGLALTNNPFVTEVTELRLSQKDPRQVYLTKEINSLKITNKDPIKMTDTKKRLFGKLKFDDALPPDETGTVEVPSEAVGNAVMALMDALSAKIKDLPEEEALKIVETLAGALESKQEASKEEIPSEKSEEEKAAAEAEMSTLKASKKAMETIIADLQKEVADKTLALSKFEEKSLETLVTDQIALGKIPAAQKDDFIALAKTNRKLFDSMISKAPATNAPVALGKTSIVGNNSASSYGQVPLIPENVQKEMDSNPFFAEMMKHRVSTIKVKS